MSKTPDYKEPPGTPMNQWVRDALSFASMSQAEAARRMTKAGLGAYDRSIVQKMTANRGVSGAEIAALSSITGFPPPYEGSTDPYLRSLSERFPLLTEDQKKAVLAVAIGFAPETPEANPE